MFLISVTYTKPLKKIDELMERRKSFLGNYFASGNFLLAGPKKPRTGGIMIASANSLAEINAIIEKDPLHKEGAAKFEVTEFIPFPQNISLSNFSD